MIRVFIFLIFAFHTTLASNIVIKHFSNANLRRIYSTLEVKNSQYFKIAKNIDHFWNHYWKYKTTQKRITEIQKLTKETKKIPIFKPFHQWFITLNKLQKIKTSKKVIKNCRNINISHEALKNKTQGICHHLFLTYLTKEIKEGKYLTPKQSQYLEKNFHKISAKHKAINKLLNTAKKNPNVYPIIKRKLKELYTSSTHYKISRRIAKKLGIKKVPKKARKKESYSASQENYKQLKTNISHVIGLVDEKEKKIIKELKKRVINFYLKNQELLPQKDSQERILKLAEYFTRRQKIKTARVLLKFLDHHTKDFDQKIHFCHLWAYILTGDYEQGLVYIRFNRLDKKYKASIPKVNFWVSHILSQQGDKRNARNILHFTVKNNPLSFYAIVGAKKLNQLSKIKKAPIENHPYQNSLNSPDHKFKIIPSKLPQNIKEAFTRLQLFAPLKRSPLLFHEQNEILSSLQQVQKIFPKATITELKADFSLLLAHILHENEKYLETFKLVYKGINKKYLSFNPRVIKLLFPRPFLGEIRKQLDEEIDPLLVLSLMRQESSFNPKAKSPVGAMGLMQLMPATARKLKKRVRKKQLHNPQINIDLGTRYIEYLMDKYEGNIVFTLAAYNAGESRVTYWKENYFTEEKMLQDIENIPFSETRKYVKLIYRNIFLYKFINAQNQLSDSSTPNKIFDLSMNYPQG